MALVSELVTRRSYALRRVLILWLFFFGLEKVHDCRLHSLVPFIVCYTICWSYLGCVEWKIQTSLFSAAAFLHTETGVILLIAFLWMWHYLCFCFTLQSSDSFNRDMKWSSSLRKPFSCTTSFHSTGKVRLMYLSGTFQQHGISKCFTWNH